MDYTSNYRLKLPAKTEVIDITVLNSNFSIMKELWNTMQIILAAVGG